MSRPTSHLEQTPVQNLATELRDLRADVDALKRGRHQLLPGWTVKEQRDRFGRHLGVLYVPTGHFTPLAEA